MLNKVYKITYLSCLSRQLTSIGKIPLSISASIGGFLSDESSLRADCTAANCFSGISLPASTTNWSRFVHAKFLSMSSSSETLSHFIPVKMNTIKINVIMLFRNYFYHCFLSHTCAITITTWLVNDYILHFNINKINLKNENKFFYTWS